MFGARLSHAQSPTPNLRAPTLKEATTYMLDTHEPQDMPDLRNILDLTEDYREEEDSLGKVRVPNSALYGAQTRRAVKNFPISGMTAHPAFIRATVLIKRAAAMANRDTGRLDANTADAI